jgi:GNAT superfamily N-acetyltransferase
MITIVRADTEDRNQHMIALAQEYVDWAATAIREQYTDIDIPAFLAEHDYAEIRTKFPGEHVPPDGCLLLARNEQHESGGCVALGKLSATICEMRTLYVRPALRGQGAGRQLVEAVIREARKIGYTSMRLDTLTFMHSALAFYHSVGFREIEPYRDIPGDI